MSWPAEATAIMVEMWGAGYSAGMISERLEKNLGFRVTRSAVLGKIHRKHMQRREEKKPKSTVQRVRRNRAVITIPHRAAIAAMLPKEISVEEAQAFDFRTEHSKTLMDLTNMTCRWPVGEPTAEDFFFCGRPTADLEDKRPYCAVHTVRSRSQYLKHFP